MAYVCVCYKFAFVINYFTYCVPFCLCIWEHKKCVIQQNYLLCIILQQKRKMKVENDADVVTGEESIEKKGDEVYIPPTLSAKRIDPEVRHCFST